METSKPTTCNLLKKGKQHINSKRHFRLKKHSMRKITSQGQEGFFVSWISMRKMPSRFYEWDENVVFVEKGFWDFFLRALAACPKRESENFIEGARLVYHSFRLGPLLIEDFNFHPTPALSISTGAYSKHVKSLFWMLIYQLGPSVLASRLFEYHVFQKSGKNLEKFVLSKRCCFRDYFEDSLIADKGKNIFSETIVHEGWSILRLRFALFPQ